MSNRSANFRLERFCPSKWSRSGDHTVTLAVSSRGSATACVCLYISNSSLREDTPSLPFFVFSLIFAIDTHPFFSDAATALSHTFPKLCAFLCAFSLFLQFHPTSGKKQKALKPFGFKAFQLVRVARLELTASWPPVFLHTGKFRKPSFFLENPEDLETKEDPFLHIFQISRAYSTIFHRDDFANIANRRHGQVVS